jgi:hypothetical protein
MLNSTINNVSFQNNQAYSCHFSDDCLEIQAVDMVFQGNKETTNIVAFTVDSPPTIYHSTLTDDVRDLMVCNQMLELVTSLTDVFSSAQKTVHCGCFLRYLTILYQRLKFHSAERDTKIIMFDNL